MLSHIATPTFEKRCTGLDHAWGPLAYPADQNPSFPDTPPNQKLKSWHASNSTAKCYVVSGTHQGTPEFAILCGVYLHLLQTTHVTLQMSILEEVLHVLVLIHVVFKEYLQLTSYTQR